MIDDNSVLNSYRKLYYQWVMARKLVSFYNDMIKGAKDFENRAKRGYTNGVIDNDSYQNAIRQTLKYIEARDEAEIVLKKVLRNIRFLYPKRILFQAKEIGIILLKIL